MDAIKTTYINRDVEPFYTGGIAATLSFDGTILATPLEDEVVITDLETHQTLHKIEGDGESITNLVITPDGTKLAILSQSQQLRIFDLELGQVTKTFKMSSPVYMSTADSTSSLFAFGGSDGVVTVWDIEGGYVTHSLKGHGTTVCSLAFYGELNSSDWKLASGDILGTVKIWDLVKRKCISTIQEHSTAVRGLAFDDEGDYFITGGRDQIVIVYNAKNFKPINTFPVSEQIECSGFINFNGHRYFYTAGSENILKIWDIKSGRIIAKSPTPMKTNEELVIIDVLKLENNNLVLVVSDQTLVELDLNNEDGEISIVNRIAGNHGIIADIRYVGPDFQYIALATNSPSLRIIDLDKRFTVRLHDGHSDLLNALDVSNDGRWIATASKDNDARVWQWDDELEDFKPYAVFKGHAGAVTAISFSKSNEKPHFLITGSNDLTIKKWNIPTVADTVVKTSEYTRRAHEKEINCIDVSPNDEFFASASYDKTGKIWNTETGETIGILKGHKRGLWDINFYKFDKLIVTGSGDKTIKVWSLTTFQCLKTFEGHTNSVQRVKFFNKQNPQLLSTGADGLIKLWDYKTEENIKTFDNHDNRIWSLNIKDDDGNLFVAADADGKISEWRDNTEEELKLREQQDKEKIEQEQNLANYISNKDWANAFLLALTLNHSMRLYNVLKSSIEANDDPDSVIGSKVLEATISRLSSEQIMLLFKKLRDWNTNFRNFEISQKLLSIMLLNYSESQLNEIPGLMKVIEAIIPYNERHFARIDDLIEQSYILDYAVEEMDRLVV